MLKLGMLLIVASCFMGGVSAAADTRQSFTAELSKEADAPSAKRAPRFVLTGGPGVGKSTVIVELVKLGYNITPEAFTLLFRQAEDAGAVESLFSDLVAFREHLMTVQCKLEATLPAKDPAFLDRSTVDIVAFGDHFKVAMSDETRKQARTDYDLVFFLDPLPASYYENTTVRRESPEESAIIHKLLKDAYLRLGYKPSQLINIPFGTPEERVKWILDHTGWR